MNSDCESQSNRLKRLWEENNNRRRAELALEEDVFNHSFGSLSGDDIPPEMFDDLFSSEMEPIQSNRNNNDEFMVRASSVAEIGRRHLQASGFPTATSSHNQQLNSMPNRSHDLMPKSHSVSVIGRSHQQQHNPTSFQPTFPTTSKNNNMFFRASSVAEIGRHNHQAGGGFRRSISTLQRPVGLSSMSSQANATFSFSNTQRTPRRLTASGIRPTGALKAPRLSFRNQRSDGGPQGNAVFINRPGASFPPVPEDVSANSAKMAIASMDSDSLLHNSCKLYPETFAIVESALQLDPGAIRRPIPLVCNPLPKDGDPIDSDSGRGSSKSQRYCYPINIALKYHASLDVVKLLAAAGPDVLALKDGPNQSSSLSIALSLNADSSVMDAILTANRACAAVSDRYTNFPLHSAIRCQHATLDIIARIHEAYPDALAATNFHRETPVDIAIRTPQCPEAVLDYLQRLAFGKMEDEAVHLHDSAGSIYDMAL